MSKFVQAAGFANVLKGLEEMATDVDTKKAVGTPVDYGRYLEEGTSQMPPYPWLEPAADSVVARGGSLAKKADDVDEIIALAAAEIEREAVQTLESTGQRPYRQTGNLAGSVTTEDLK